MLAKKLISSSKTLLGEYWAFFSPVNTAKQWLFPDNSGNQILIEIDESTTSFTSFTVAHIDGVSGEIINTKEIDGVFGSLSNPYPPLKFCYVEESSNSLVIAIGTGHFIVLDIDSNLSIVVNKKIHNVESFWHTVYCTGIDKYSSTQAIVSYSVPEVSGTGNGDYGIGLTIIDITNGSIISEDIHKVSYNYPDGNGPVGIKYPFVYGNMPSNYSTAGYNNHACFFIANGTARAYSKYLYNSGSVPYEVKDGTYTSSKPLSVGRRSGNSVILYENSTLTAPSYITPSSYYADCIDNDGTSNYIGGYNGSGKATIANTPPFPNSQNYGVYLNTPSTSNISQILYDGVSTSKYILISGKMVIDGANNNFCAKLPYNINNYIGQDFTLFTIENMTCTYPYGTPNGGNSFSISSYSLNITTPPSLTENTTELISDSTKTI